MSQTLYDMKFMDSAGAFLIGELERLDPIVHEPLMEVYFHRDLPIRTDVTLADEQTSFVNADYGMVGGLKGDGTGINWRNSETNVYGRPAINLAKTISEFRPVAYGCEYDYVELESSMKLGRPIDQMQIATVNRKHQLDCDRQAYVGNTDFNDKGLVNSSLVTVANVPNGAGNSPYWTNKTPDEILSDINAAITAAWNASGNAVAPSKILVPTVVMKDLLKPMSNTGISILEYVKANSIYRAITGNDLTISPVKWLDHAGVSGVGRIIAYTPNENYVRFPMTPLQRLPLVQDMASIRFCYVGRIGCVEFVKPETLYYMDGVSQA